MDQALSPSAFSYFMNLLSGTDYGIGKILVYIGCALVGLLYAQQLYKNKTDWQFPKWAYLPSFIFYVGILMCISTSSAPSTLAGVSAYFLYGISTLVAYVLGSIIAAFNGIFIYEGFIGACRFVEEVRAARKKEGGWRVHRGGIIP